MTVFNQLFRDEYFTVLEGGASEPLYTPFVDGQYAKILFSKDYFASALHEVAHWCIAGEERRKLEDYGYWYEPDGRTEEQQAEFEQVEVKPQAIEWVLSNACGFRFKVSADNLNNGLGPNIEFKRNIVKQAQAYCAGAMPRRAYQFALALMEEFKVASPFDRALYRLEYLE